MCNDTVTCSHSCPADGHRAAEGTHLHRLGPVEARLQHEAAVQRGHQILTKLLSIAKAAKRCVICALQGYIILQ